MFPFYLFHKEVSSRVIPADMVSEKHRCSWHLFAYFEVSPVSFLSEVRKIRWNLHCLLCQVLLIRKWLQCTMWRRCLSVWLGRRIGSLSEEDGCSILQAAPPRPHFDLVFCMPRICKTKAYVHKWRTNTKDHLFSVLLDHYHLHCIW